MQPQPASELEAEMERLQRAIEMLTRSNKELKEAMAQAPDPEFKQAVEENIVIIAKYRARVFALEEELRRLRGLRGAGVTEALDTTQQQRSDPRAAPPASGGSGEGGSGGAGAPDAAMAEAEAGAEPAAGGAAGAAGAEQGEEGRQQAGGDEGGGGGVWL